LAQNRAYVIVVATAYDFAILDLHDTAIKHFDPPVRGWELTDCASQRSGVRTSVGELDDYPVTGGNDIRDLDRAIRKRRAPSLVIASVVFWSTEKLTSRYIDKFAIFGNCSGTTFWILFCPRFMERAGDSDVLVS
jgi:hypothetical protein